MEILIERDYAALSDRAARIVLEEVARKPDLALGLVSGRTPQGLYDRLRASKDVFARARFFNVEEFFGATPASRHSVHRVLSDQFLSHVAHLPANVHFLDGHVHDLEAEGRRYEALLRAAGGIDLYVLGLGKLGEIGSNGPGSSLASRTRPKTLEPDALADAMPTLDTEAPVTSFTVTVGIGTFLEGRRILLLASGPEKAEMVHRMAEGPLTSEVPASALQLHPRATVVVDEPAAAKLRRRDYWKWVAENKWRVGQ
jgi:glucosamine-6-phosphate deaminase